MTTTVMTILAALFLACVPVAYWRGRRSAYEDREWEARTRLPVINDQVAQDQGGGG